VNNGLTTTDIAVLAINPQNTSTLYAGTNGGGVFKSSNGGGSWTAVNNGLWGWMYVDALVIDPQNPGTLYVAEGGDVYKTINGGQNWVDLNLNDYNSPCIRYTSDSVLAVDPQNPDTVYLGRGGELLKTTNGGENWNALRLRNTLVNVLLDAPNPDTLFAGTFNGVFKSVDGGVHWFSLTEVITNVTALAMDPLNPNILYAGTQGYFSYDYGGYISGSGILKSTDGGVTWVAVNNGLLNLEITALAIDPSNSALVYAGTDGGGYSRAPTAGETGYRLTLV
jgi:photosystem II stability/assembly factor-like uncharacterized protein